MDILKDINLMIMVVLLTVGVLVAPGHAEIDPETVVGAWLLDEDEGNEAMDSSGNGSTGVAAAGDLEWVTGKFGSALEVVPGGGSRVHVEHNDAFNLEDFTLMAWVKFNSVGIHQDIALKQSANSDRNYQIQKNASDRARSSFASGGQAGAGSVTSSTTLTTDIWYHIAATYDGTEFKMHLDGQLEGTKQTSLEPDNNTNAFSIGAHPNGGNTVDGLVDEVALFNVALTAEDIQVIMNEGLASALNMIAVSPTGRLAATWAGIKKH